MTADSWKSFAKESPSECQNVLLLFPDGSVRHVRHYKRIGTETATHWQLWSDPDEADPFEEYWRTRRRLVGYPPEIQGLFKQWCLDGWVGHERWAKEHQGDK